MLQLAEKIAHKLTETIFSVQRKLTVIAIFALNDLIQGRTICHIKVSKHHGTALTGQIMKSVFFFKKYTKQKYYQSMTIISAALNDSWIIKFYTKVQFSI